MECNEKRHWFDDRFKCRQQRPSKYIGVDKVSEEEHKGDLKSVEKTILNKLH